MTNVAEILPLTHSISAARLAVSGVAWSSVAGQLVIELVIGTCGVVAGLLLLRLFEYESHRRATLDAA
jgi:ABC-2 type transport system permease protein